MDARAPDSVEPAVGWRVWDAVELGGAFRLCSLAFWSIWLPRVEAQATCRRSATVGLAPHSAPGVRCTCGIYATRTARQALDYSGTVRRKRDTAARVVGRVSLWGTVVEGAGGWRASHAYPAALYVPARRRGRSGRTDEGIALSLRDYGVPVELLDARTDRELLGVIEPAVPPL
jgi:hypothetical protein